MSAAMSTLSLHDALPICAGGVAGGAHRALRGALPVTAARGADLRSEEHTSELQSRVDLVCRLLLEKKKARKRRSLGVSEPPPRAPVQSVLRRVPTPSDSA